MRTELYKITTGSLLHDVGKVVHRTGDSHSHAESGYAFLKEQTGLDDAEILQQVRFHHAAELKNAGLAQNSLAYITYIADNIASATDRRTSDAQGYGFSRDLPLDSIFNLLNGNDEHMKYAPKVLDGSINYPALRSIKYDETFYSRCLDNIRDSVKGIDHNEAYINSLLEVLEANLTYVPSSTSREEVADISLFDHSKLTAALGCCIWEYLNAQGVTDYRERLFTQAASFYQEKAFLLYSIDISGIQDFIYSIADDGALKALRARSFYLELLMEHLVDTILGRIGVSRANCIYCGGGHAYLLLANTEQTIKTLTAFENDINGWFLDMFGTALYAAGGYAPCSANDLKNEPDGTYKLIFREVSNQISARKLKRYTAAQLLAQDIADFIPENTMSMLRAAECRLQLDQRGYAKAMQGIDHKFQPIEMGDRRQLFEYVLSLQIKMQQGNYSDFLRGLTPVVLDLFEMCLKDQLKITPEQFCYKTNIGAYRISADVMQKSEVGKKIMHALQQGFGDLNIKEEFIGSMPIMKIFEQMSSNTELVDDLHRMRAVESDVRNVAAHEIVSVTDDWIFRKTKMHAEDIMKLLKRLVIYAGVKAKNEYWNSYSDMNRVIAENL